MRPLPGGDALPAAKPPSRKSSVADSSAATSHGPTTFFLRSEDEMEQCRSASRSFEAVARHRDSTFGVQSLEETLEASFGRKSRTGDSKGDDASGTVANESSEQRQYFQGSPKVTRRETESCKSSPTRTNKRKTSTHSMSNSRTPLNFESRSPVPVSAIPSTSTSASLCSLKLSDGDPGLDEAASQAVASSGDEDEGIVVDESGSFPQLVMPSIQMPSRKPFTAKGKAMGKLKVLVAGAAGTGKTSLIRSIVQFCDDIVHVDSLSPTNSFAQSPPLTSKSRKRKAELPGTSIITEIHASTKTCPPWYTDVEESRVLRRRKSTTESVLERNICFVDTPGLGLGTSRSEDMSRVIDYVESLMHQTASVTTLDDGDLIGVISGSGGVSVDVVFYLLPPSKTSQRGVYDEPTDIIQAHDISNDIEFMKRLAALTNVIPIIAKSDTLSLADLAAVKISILARLQTTSIRPFLFGTSLDDALLAVQGLSVDENPAVAPESATAAKDKQLPFTVPTHPYAVSSVTGPDTETMEASLLMSPDYRQPLLPSELSTLVNQVFDPESIAWLRYSAAKKFTAWRRRTRLPVDSHILQGLQQQHDSKRGSVLNTSLVHNGVTTNSESHNPTIRTKLISKAPSATSSLFSAVSPSGVLVPRSGASFYTSNIQSPFPASSPSISQECPETLDPPTDFSLTRYHHATQGEQRLAEVRLAKWATDLQRSLRNERERYEDLQRNERAKWLLERVGEEVSSGNIIASPGGSPRADWAVVRRGNEKEAIGAGQRCSRAPGLDSRDPLGLCDFSDEVRRRGFVLVKVLGGVSVLGAVMMAAVRASGLEMGWPEGGLWSWLTDMTA